MYTNEIKLTQPISSLQNIDQSSIDWKIVETLEDYMIKCKNVVLSTLYNPKIDYYYSYSN